MNRDTHIIHRVNLEIEVPNVDRARDIQERILRVLYNDILPRLEKWMESLDFGNMAMRVDSLGIDIGSLDTATFENDLQEKVFNAIRENIGSFPSRLKEHEDGERVILPPEEQVFETFLYFLETGRLPWYSDRTGQALKNEVLLKSSLQKAENSAGRLLQLLQSHDNAVPRLFSQFPADLIILVISILISKIADISREEASAMLQRLTQRLGHKEKGDTSFGRDPQKHLLEKVIMYALSEKESFERQRFQSFLEDLPGKDHQEMPGRKLPRPSARDQEDEPGNKNHEEGPEGVYLEHAGLVLLHPFLEYFFKELDLLKDGSFNDDEARALAIHLLNYLATGRENPPEYELVFEKYLCGMDLEAPVERVLPLSQSMKIESESLLRAAIGHWRALKNTSPDGLREGFLQRPGKLVLNEFQHRLIVEGKTHDVLLAYLPWGYGVIKLPWLVKPLYVDWAD